MTDRQFDAFQSSLLRDLRRIEKAIREKYGENECIEDLKTLMEDTEKMLKRP
ncbi:MAG: hypothetical protein LBC82_03140 [Oscillospiraceae bacterium]|nr:hypothetical protein [Oscillospiraceae bacterium]